VTLEIKSSLGQIKNTDESHSCWWKQIEGSISEDKDKIYIKEKSKEFLVKDTGAMTGLCKNSGLNQNAKPVSHGHWGRRRGASHRYI
jgi:hypothetical protein